MRGPEKDQFDLSAAEAIERVKLSVLSNQAVAEKLSQLIQSGWQEKLTGQEAAAFLQWLREEAAVQGLKLDFRPYELAQEEKKTVATPDLMVYPEFARINQALEAKMGVAVKLVFADSWQEKHQEELKAKRDAKVHKPQQQEIHGLKSEPNIPELILAVKFPEIWHMAAEIAPYNQESMTANVSFVAQEFNSIDPKEQAVAHQLERADVISERRKENILVSFQKEKRQLLQQLLAACAEKWNKLGGEREAA